MWHLMVFTDETKSQPLKVISVHTIKEVAYIVGMAPQSVSNFFHNLIKARGTLKYVALFKG
jgi:hypothetical protein